MSAANKAKGTRYESDVCQWLQEEGIKAKRLPRSGSKDIGDAAFPLDGIPVSVGTAVLEIKNRASLDWPTFLTEASIEADNYEAKYPAEGPAHPIVIAKRRGKGVGQSYVVMDLESFVDLLRDLGAV